MGLSDVLITIQSHLISPYDHIAQDYLFSISAALELDKKVRHSGRGPC